MLVLDHDGKLVIFDYKGQPLDEFNLNLLNPRGIGLVGNNVIIGSTFPGSATYLTALQIHTKEVGQVGPAQSFAHTLMAGVLEAGPMVVRDGKIYVIPPHGKKLYVFSGTTLDKFNEFELKINGFEYADLRDSQETYLNDARKRRAFINGNSVVTGWHPLGSGWVAEVLFWNDYRRELIVFDQNLEPVCQGKVPTVLKGLNDPSVQFSDGTYLYFYREEMQGNEYRKVLSRYRIGCE